MAKHTRLEKLTDCEYELVDASSAPCHNPPMFIDRKGGFVVCIAHYDSLETFLAHKAGDFDAEEAAAKGQTAEEFQAHAAAEAARKKAEDESSFFSTLRARLHWNKPIPPEPPTPPAAE